MAHNSPVTLSPYLYLWSSTNFKAVWCVLFLLFPVYCKSMYIPLHFLLWTAYHTFTLYNNRPIAWSYETADKILIFGLVVFQLYSAEPWGSAGDIQGFRQHISFILELLNIILIISHCIASHSLCIIDTGFIWRCKFPVRKFCFSYICLFEFFNKNLF
jgi:hypothetical protein